MKINIWKEPERQKYYFALHRHKDTLLGAIMAEFYCQPEIIEYVIELIKKGSELGENNEV